MIILYNTFWFIGIVLALPLIVLMLLISEKRRQTFAYRIGIKRLPARIVGKQNRLQKKKSVWIHALSVGEVLSAVALVKAFRESFSQHDIYFSVSTQAGFEIAKERLGRNVDALFFFPYDFFFSVRRIVGTVDSELVVIVETDVWPNFLNEMKRSKVPVFLVNARISDKSFRGYRRFSYFSRKLFSGFAKIYTQSQQDADRFTTLGVAPARLQVTGNIKFDQIGGSLSDREKSKLRQRLQIEPGMKVFIAGSTHNGEEMIFRNIFPRMKRHISDLILIIAPRDPRRARYVQQLFGEAGVEAALMAQIKYPGPDRGSDVLIIDRIGLLGRLYGLADIAFVGGSLASFGGHNPLEPAAFSIPILFGPDMSDFKQISQMLVNAGAAIEVKDQESLLRAVVEIFRKDNRAAEMGMRAYGVFCEKRGAVDRTLEAIKRALEPDGKRLG